MIRQVYALFEGRVKIVVQGSYINLTCLRTTEMKKRKHLEGDKDIMMGHTTFKCQWNGQFYKPSGRQVLLKHENLLNEFPNTLVTIFFPHSEFCPVFWHKNKGKRMSSSSRMPEPGVCLFPGEEGEEVACLSLQNMENFSTEDGRSRLTDIVEGTYGKV